MYSLNQVNKLVSCGRDPARSLPLWRGFLLIPLILVCFAFAPNAQTVLRTPDPQAIPARSTRQTARTPFSTTSPALETRHSVAIALAQNIDGQLQYWRWCWQRWFSTARMRTRRVGAAALLFNVDGTRNTACGAAAMVNNVGDVDHQDGLFNDAVGAFALNANTTGFSNNAVGDSALFRNITGAQNTAVGDVALVNNDATGSGLPISTRQLALWRSSITLLVVRTQPWVQGQDQTWSLASITLTSATSLVTNGTRCRRRQYDPHRRPLGGWVRVRKPASSVVSSTTPSLLAAALL